MEKTVSKKTVRWAVLVIVVAAAACLPAWAGDKTPKNDPKFPRMVLIIRHAEKPTKSEHSPLLSPKGEERARMLTELFKVSKARPQPLPRPDFIFAAADKTSSHRPVDTVKPLAKELKLPIRHDYTTDATRELAEEILHNPKFAGKVLLISWRHSRLPHLARDLKASAAPDVWEDDVFDRIWQITYDAGGKAAFVNRPMRLLPKDSDK
jgi:hypothetical protein